jgi:hypothetical protein
MRERERGGREGGREREVSPNACPMFPNSLEPFSCKNAVSFANRCAPP